MNEYQEAQLSVKNEELLYGNELLLCLIVYLECDKLLEIC